MKNICFYIENYYLGGLDTFVLQLINNWPIDKHRITVLCNKSHAGAELLKQHIAHPHASVECHEMWMYRDWANSFFRNHNSFLYKFMVALSYVFLIPYYILCGYRKLHLERFDSLFVINGGYPAALSCRCIPISWTLYTKKKSIMNFHNHGIKSKFWYAPFDFLIDKMLLWSISDFVSVSKVCAESIRIRRPFQNLENLHYIYNGISSDVISPTFSLKEELGLDGKSHILMMLSTYEERKGHKHILSVFQRIRERIPDVHLVFCGYGTESEKAAVRIYANGLGLDDSVSILGFKQNAMEYLAQTDLLLIGSQQFESFGLTAIEAMKYKKVVLSTNIGGLKEVIQDGEGGFLFDKNDVEGMADKAVYLLKNPSLMDLIGERGFERYNRNFTIQKMVNGYVGYIGRL